MRLKPTRTYEVIASALRAARPPPLFSIRPGEERQPTAHDAAYLQWEHDVRAIAHALRADYPSFRFDLFFNQCGYTNGEV